MKTLLAYLASVSLALAACNDGEVLNPVQEHQTFCDSFAPVCPLNILACSTASQCCDEAITPGCHEAWLCEPCCDSESYLTTVSTCVYVGTDAGVGDAG